MKTLADRLQAEIQRRQTARPHKVVSVFNIGTGHTRAEVNNTIAALGKACTDPDKVVNDGPTGVLGNLQGWGMNDALSSTVARIKAAGPTVVNMTGHSRGAILCHMIAHALYTDAATRDIKVNMMVLDPVHQSKLGHAGAEALDDNPSLLSYHAIIMEHEDKTILGGTTFPYKFVTASPGVQERMHYINMPGKHGSGSQNLTSPIGRLCFELIAGFMRTRRTAFSTPVPEPIDLCEHFAQVHLLNPGSVDGAQRLLFDDGGHASATDPSKHRMHGTQLRAADVTRALRLNSLTVQKPGQKVLPRRPLAPYFFNAEHAFYFKLCFPYFFRVLAAAPSTTRFDSVAFQRDFDRMGTRPGLARSFAMLAVHLQPLLA
jgi:hypothetical protein